MSERDTGVVRVVDPERVDVTTEQLRDDLTASTADVEDTHPGVCVQELELTGLEQRDAARAERLEALARIREGGVLRVYTSEGTAGDGTADRFLKCA